MTAEADLAQARSASAPLVSVQILRALAALGVMGVHVRNAVATRPGAHEAVPDFTLGLAGVDLFFVISGFIMVYASAALFGSAAGPATFFKRRLARIVPLYWAATAAVALCFVVLRYKETVAGLTWDYVAASLLFVPYPRPDGLMLPLHMLGWTLNYEMFFYLAFALALWLTARVAVAAVTGVFVVMVLAQLFLGPLPQPLAFWCDPIILEFCAGMAIALAFRAGWRIGLLATILCVLAGIVGLALATGPLGGLPRAVKWGIPAAAIMAGVVLGPAPRNPGWVARGLAFLGDASYALYLMHLPVILVCSSALVKFRIEIAWGWGYGLALVVASLAAAIVAYLAFERPITAALRRHLEPRAAKMSAAQPIGARAGSLKHS